MCNAKRGRPPISEHGATCASTMLPSDIYDSICRYSMEHDVSVSQLIRTFVELDPVWRQYIEVLKTNERLTVKYLDLTGKSIEMALAYLQACLIIDGDDKTAAATTDLLKQPLEMLQEFVASYESRRPFRPLGTILTNRH
jgi:hypothetical protein